MKKKLDSYLLSHRRRCGFSQGELSYLLGYKDQSHISRLEKGKRDPNLFIVLACQILFDAPPAEIFPGLFERAEEEVLTRAYELHQQLEDNPSKEARLKLNALDAAFDRREVRAKSDRI
jgi:transcriptional regulator with XRE-family HTH domain